MIVNCCVPGCKDRRTSRHRFPNPIKDRVRFDRWIELIGNMSLVDMDPIQVFNNRRVCDLHFHKSVRTSNMFISRSSLPSLNLPTPPSKVEDDSLSLASCSYIDVSDGNTTYIPRETINQEGRSSSPTPSSRLDYYCLSVASVVVHRFPNFEKFPERFNAWVKLAASRLGDLSDEYIHQNRRVCDIHFKPEDHNRNNRLNALAIPSLNLPGENIRHDDSTNELLQILNLPEDISTDLNNIDAENINHIIETKTVESFKVCRICMKKTTDPKNIFADFLDQTVPIHMAMTVCLYPIEVSINDSLPKYICDKCLEALSICVNLRTMAKRNDSILRETLNEKTPSVPLVKSTNKRNMDIQNDFTKKKKIEVMQEPTTVNMCAGSMETASEDINSAPSFQPRPYERTYIKRPLVNQCSDQNNTSKENIIPGQQMTQSTIELDKNKSSASPKNVECNSDHQSNYLNVSFCFVEGYLMEHKFLKGNVRYLKCTQAKCPAVGTQELIPGLFRSDVNITKNHNHKKPSDTEIKKLKIISVVRKKLQNVKGSTLKSIYDEICKLDPDAAQLIPLENLPKEICNL